DSRISQLPYWEGEIPNPRYRSGTPASRVVTQSHAPVSKQTSVSGSVVMARRPTCLPSDHTLPTLSAPRNEMAEGITWKPPSELSERRLRNTTFEIGVVFLFPGFFETDPCQIETRVMGAFFGGWNRILAASTLAVRKSNFSAVTLLCTFSD